MDLLAIPSERNSLWEFEWLVIRINFDIIDEGNVKLEPADKELDLVVRHLF
jgi:hypothetical protein